MLKTETEAYEEKLKQPCKRLILFFRYIRMLELSLNKLKLAPNSRGIKGYKSMSKENLLSALDKSDTVESENSFDGEGLKG